MVEGAEQSYSKELLAGYDVVGFDPRGVGSSTGIKCGDATLGMEASKEKPQPGEAFETWAANYLTKVREAREQCEAHSEPGLLDHVNTVSVAKDLDVLRAISGEKSLNYLGFSYGTELGYTYAELFPQETRGGWCLTARWTPPSLTRISTSTGLRPSRMPCTATCRPVWKEKPATTVR